MLIVDSVSFDSGLLGIRYLRVALTFMLALVLRLFLEMLLLASDVLSIFIRDGVIFSAIYMLLSLIM